MAEFFTQWGIEILFAISTAIAVGICKHFANKAKAYQKLIEEKGTYYQLYTGAFELE